MRTVALAFFLSLMICSGAYGFEKKGASVKETFSLANLALADERYDEAIAGYRKIEDLGISNPDVFYNLGNAYAKSERYGLAVYYYEKSLNLLNRKDARYNLSLVREKLSMSAQSIDARSPLEMVLGYITLKESYDMALILYVVAFILAAAACVYRSSDRGRVSARLAKIISLMFMVALLFSTAKYYVQNWNHYAVVTGPGAELFEAPVYNIEASGQLSEGMKLKITGSGNGWVKLDSPEGTTGWVKTEQLGII